MKKFLVVLMVMALVGLFMVTPQAEAACTQALANQAKTSWLGGMFSLSDTYKIAFYTDSATWSSSTAQYSATNEVTGTNYTAGGFVLGTLTISIDTGTAYMDWPDEVNNNITFDAASTCAIIYDDTIADSTCSGADDPWDCCTGASTGTCADSALYIGTFTSVQPSDGTLTVTFPTADGTNAIIRIAKDSYEFFKDLFSPTEAWAYENGLRVDALVELEGIAFSGAPGQVATH